jgi:hypothetical protein
MPDHRADRSSFEGRTERRPVRRIPNIELLPTTCALADNRRGRNDRRPNQALTPRTRLSQRELDRPDTSIPLPRPVPVAALHPFGRAFPVADAVSVIETVKALVLDQEAEEALQLERTAFFMTISP